MAISKPFKFKQFTLNQEHCAMKIGTDGVLLGAWTSLKNNPESILDIGTGTGIIALMLAQRSRAEQIDALEIDEMAHQQAVENFENSPWADRLFCYHATFQEFVEEMYEDGIQYDVIVSNPPFHTENVFTKNQQRDQARFAQALPFEVLLQGVSKLLAPAGTFHVIIPKKAENEFINLAQELELYPQQTVRVKGTATAPVKRVLLQLGKSKIPIIAKTLVLEVSRHKYTKEYQALVSEFYL